MEMMKFQMTIEIDATPEVVWHALTDPVVYKKWAVGFSPDSQFEGKWEQGAKMKFIDPGMGGTLAVLDEVIPLKTISVRHIAVLDKEGNEDPDSAFAEVWVGTVETYNLSSENGQTKLTIDTHSHPRFEKMLKDGWGKSLPLLKELCEKR